MADFALTALPALGGVDLQFDTCKLTESVDMALISVAVPLNGKDALSEKLKERWGLSIPGSGMTHERNGIRAIPMTQDQFLLMFTPNSAVSEASVQTELDGVAYTTLQTDAWVILELSGSGSHAALERICPIDLDVASFPPGASARTSMEHLGVCIVRLENDRFQLLSARSSAQSFLHAVETSCRWTAP